MFVTAAVLALLQGPTASAQQAPLAIPANPPARPARRAQPTTPAQLQAIRRYRTNYLSVQDISQYYSSGYYVSHGYGWWPWGGFAMGYAPTYRVDDWGVFKGRARVDVPTYLKLVDHADQRAQLMNRIHRKQVAAGVLYGTGIAGGATALVGLVQMEVAHFDFEYERGAMLTTGGTLAMVVGLLAASFPAASSRRLRDRHSATLDRGAVEDEINSYNEALRVDLGLSPDQVLRAEAEPVAPR